MNNTPNENYQNEFDILLTNPNNVESHDEMVEFRALRWRSWINIAIYLFCFYIVAIIFQLIISFIYMKVKNITADVINPSSPLYNGDIYEEYYIKVSSYTNFFTYLLLVVVLVLVSWKILVDDFKSYKTSRGKIWLAILIGFIGMYVVNIFTNIIITTLQDLFNLTEVDAGASENQQIIEKMFSASAITAIMTIFATVIAAPIVEELIFRKSLFGLFKRKNWVPVILSALIFGSIHVIPACLEYILEIIGGSDTITWKHVFNELLYLISYVGSGLVLCSVYHYCKRNLMPVITIHFFNNLLASISILLLLLLENFFPDDGNNIGELIKIVFNYLKTALPI